MRNRTRKKGALPVPYIVAIIIAILVIAVLVYWFFVLTNQGTTTSSETICRGKEIAYCTQWSASGYNPDRQPSAEDFTLWATDCATYSWAKSVNPSACRQVLGQQT
jgi:hypothetical protein